MKRATEDLYYTDPINWSETEVHKMLGVPADACRAIRNKQIELSEYKRISERYPNLPLGKLIARNRIVRSQYGTLDSVLRDTGLSDAKLFKYLKGQPDVTLSDFYDYLRQAKRLGYDFSDKSVVAPKSIAAAHDRLNVIEQALVQERIAKKPEQQQSEFQKHMKKRKKLEYSDGEYIIRQPLSVQEIVDEGKALSHCVGGYANRHANGVLTIMFLRKKSEPDKPFYTIEVGKNYKIVQCRGYKNNWIERGGEEKPQEIIDLEKRYQSYLDSQRQLSKRNQDSAQPYRRERIKYGTDNTYPAGAGTAPA